MAIIKTKSEEKETAIMEHMNHALSEIYKNKSADEYKMHGDITQSSEYETLERMVSDLKILKGFSKTEADAVSYTSQTRVQEDGH